MILCSFRFRKLHLVFDSLTSQKNNLKNDSTITRFNISSSLLSVFCILQKKYYFCCLVFNIYDIVYFMKEIANTISHTAVYGRVIGNAMCCTSNAYFLIPSIFVHNLKKTIHIPLASRWRGWHISEQIKNLK